MVTKMFFSIVDFKYIFSFALCKGLNLIQSQKMLLHTRSYAEISPCSKDLQQSLQNTLQ